MRVVTWNMKRAKASAEAWDLLRDLDPDVAFLQEVAPVPADITRSHDRIALPNTRKDGTPWSIQSLILARRGLGLRHSPVRSQRPWLDAELRRYSGNLIGAQIQANGEAIDLVGVRSPAWELPFDHVSQADIDTIRLPQHRDKIWLTDVVYAALSERGTAGTATLIRAGDFNTSETFDHPRPRGNRTWLDRMASLGLVEALRSHAGRLVPTYKDNRSRLVKHQMDHVFVGAGFGGRLERCSVGSGDVVFGRGHSDHLPIVADFLRS